MLEDAGDFDNIEENILISNLVVSAPMDTHRNEIDRTLNIFLVNFSGDDETPTISRSEITTLGAKPDECLKICLTIRYSTAFHL